MQDVYKLRERLDSKTARVSGFQAIHSGQGSGHRCDGCGAAIDADESEFELIFQDAGREVSIRLHPECWGAWRGVIDTG